MRIHFLLIGMSIAIFWSCKKTETVQVQFDKVNVSSQPVNDVFCLNDTVGLACSGVENVGGRIYLKQGTGWSEVFSSSPVNLLSVYITPSGKAFAGGDFVHLYTSYDSGASWQLDWMGSGELSTHEHNRVSIDEFHFINDSTGFFVGGDRYEHGHIYRTHNQGDSWNFDTLRNEVTSITEVDNNTFLFAGYGYLGRTYDQGNSISRLPNGNHNFIGIHAVSPSSIVAITNSGKILLSEDTGSSWKKIAKIRGAVILNSIFAQDNLYAIGAEGSCYYSTDYGNTWKQIELDTNDHLYGISVSDNYLWISSHGGDIYQIPLTAIL